MIIAGIISLVIIFTLYQLLINGYLFKIPLFFGGMLAIWAALGHTFPSSTKTLITISEVNFSAAAVAAVIVGFCALLTTRD